jgi:hypothetical protein
MFPLENDRTEVMRWCATLIERLDIKMRYGILLCSEEQGVGKTTLGLHILRPLVGETNVSLPSAGDIVDSHFTDWKAHCRLVMINEIYEGQSTKAYDKLKEVITEDHISVVRKYMEKYDTENWVHVLACSNHKNALKLPDEDRRWFVPLVTEDKRNQQYWEEFYGWLNNKGLGIIKQWAIDWLKDNKPVHTGATPPNSGAKAEMIKEGMSRGQLLVYDWLERHLNGYNGVKDVVITDMVLVEMIRQVIYEGRPPDGKLERALGLRKIARRRGWHVGKERKTIISKLENAFLISNNPELLNLTTGQISSMKNVKFIKNYNDIATI